MLIRCLTVTSLMLLCSATITAQDLVQWKFRSGQNLNYSIVQDMKTSTKFGEEIVSQHMVQTINMSWKTLGTSAGGDAVVQQVFDRVRVNMEGGPAGKIAFDSTKPGAGDNPVMKALADAYGKIIGQPFQMTMAPSGAISKVKIPQGLLSAVQDSQAGRSGVLTEKMLTDMMKKSAVMLPERPVSPGDTWKTTQVVDMPFGTTTITSNMKLVRKENGNAIIAFVPSVSITPRENVATKIQLAGSTGKGQISFDVANGRVNKTHLDLTLDMTIDINGQKVPQRIRNVTAMTLAQ